MVTKFLHFETSSSHNSAMITNAENSWPNAPSSFHF